MVAAGLVELQKKHSLSVCVCLCVCVQKWPHLVAALLAVSASAATALLLYVFKLKSKAWQHLMCATRSRLVALRGAARGNEFRHR